MIKAMNTSRDLVCSMDVKVAQSPLCTAHRGFVYHFCSPAAEGLKFMQRVMSSGGVSGNTSNPASWKAQRIQAPGRSATGHR